MIDISRQFPRLRNYVLELNYAVEHNEIRNKATDTVIAQSFSFQTLKAAIKSSPVKPNRWGITYFTRTDAYPYLGDLARSDQSHNINVTAEVLKNEKHQFRFTGTYRKLTILNSKITTQKPDNSLLGRAEYQVNGLKGLITGNLLYE